MQNLISQTVFDQSAFKIDVSGYEEHLWNLSLQTYEKSYRVVVFTHLQVAK